MTSTRLHRFAALFVFLFAFILYTLTVTETTAFWDTGEFIASVYQLQVMHPPGAPVYMLLGRLFSMFVPVAYVAFAVNLISVLASAVTILLTYLIIVRFIREWRTQAITFTAIAGAVIGALAFAATDSFWYNAVEAEVYALSMFFTSIIVWLILKWSEAAEREYQVTATRLGWRSSRYLILVAYCFGLAIGTHLMALLPFFFLVLIVFFKLFDQGEWTWFARWKRIVLLGGVSSVAFLMLYPGMVITLPAWADASGTPILFVLAIIGLLTIALAYTHRRQQYVANLVLVSVVALMVGYSSIMLIPIRSTANPPIDLNNPETAEELVPYLQRQQYGDTPLLKGPTFNERTNRFDPNNEVLFPRRHSFLPAHESLYAGYESDWDYFTRYQMGHMYWRYFMWNFVGKAKDTQHSTWMSGFSEAPTAQVVYRTPSEEASRNVYFALPLLLGLFGLLYHFRNDWRRAFSLSILFILTGMGLVVYLNEIPVTPRERDYIYVASFFAFSIWIGIGAAGLLEYARQALKQLRLQQMLQYSLVTVTAALLFLAVPGWMLSQNFDDHDRSDNHLARDFAYNMLMSLEEDAIIFTEGDNDTYPLWYLQNVEGIRRDVRVVCLSLLNTPWYAKQLKNQWSYTSAPLPISLTNEQLSELDIAAWQPREWQLPVPNPEFVEQTELALSVEDTSGFESPMRWTIEGRPYSSDFNLLYIVDQMVLDILTQNAREGWERPIYFASTTAPTSQLNLQPYFQREGMSYRIVPIRHNQQGGRVIPEIMKERLSHFRFTNLNDSDVYYPDDARGFTGLHYRDTFNLTAEALMAEGKTEEAKTIMEAAMDAVPLDTIPIALYNALPMANTFQALGETERSVEIMRNIEPVVFNNIETATSNRSLTQAVQVAQMVQATYMRAGAFEDASDIGSDLADALGDEGYRQPPEVLRQLFEEAMR